jgi:hypothetical protein
MLDSPHRTWFEPKLTKTTILEANVEAHVITMKLNDVRGTMDWCLEHDALCSQVAANAYQFAKQHLTKQNVYDYVADVCNASSRMLSMQPEPAAFVEPSVTLPECTNKTVSTSNITLVCTLQDDDKHLSDSTVPIVYVTASKGEAFNHGLLCNIGAKRVKTTYAAFLTYKDFKSVQFIADREVLYDNIALLKVSTFMRMNGFPNNAYDVATTLAIAAQRMAQQSMKWYGMGTPIVGLVNAAVLPCDLIEWRRNGVQNVQPSILEIMRDNHPCFTVTMNPFKEVVDEAVLITEPVASKPKPKPKPKLKLKPLEVLLDDPEDVEEDVTVILTDEHFEDLYLEEPLPKTVDPDVITVLKSDAAKPDAAKPDASKPLKSALKSALKPVKPDEDTMEYISNDETL